MISTALVLLGVAAGSRGGEVNARTFFALLKNYSASFHDVTFLYEGDGAKPEQDHSRRIVSRFQGLYAYRADGASLVDVFGFDTGGKPDSRLLFGILNHRLEMLNASPDIPTPIRHLEPVTTNGGPGSLNRPNAPERIFLAWFFNSLGDPSEYDYEADGWGDVGNHHCLKVRMLEQPRSRLKGWIGGLPLVRYWADLERDGYPLRIEYYRGDDLELRTEIQRLERVPLPNGRHIWFPAEGKSESFGAGIVDGKAAYSKEPTFFETHKILLSTLKFDQNLRDSFFDVKKHAAVANDEDLRKLQHELGRFQVAERATVKPKSQRSDPESLQKQLEDALAEADRQAQRLEASSAARQGVGWWEVVTWGLGVAGIAAFSGALYWSWRRS